MSLAELASQLEQDAAQSVPPFGAESIRIAERGGQAAVPLLLEHIASRKATAFLALEALRLTDETAYAALPRRQRAEIYLNALRESRSFNTWGLPNLQLTDTAKALIGIQQDAVPGLTLLLSDKRSALLEGSKDGTTAVLYGNRVCDYAWVFLMQIKNRTYTYFQDSAERDKAIAALQHEL